MKTKNFLEKILFLPDFVKYLLFFGIWLLIGTILYFLFINPQFKEIQKKQIEYTRIRKKTLMIVRVQKELNKFKKEFKEIKKLYQLAIKKLPNTREIPNLILRISSYGKENNLSFLLFKPKKEIKKEFYVVIPISLKFTGDFVNTGNFFYEIGKTTRIVKIKNFTITKRKNNSIYVNALIETYKFIKNSKKNAKKKK